MNLDKITLEDLKGDQRELAELIGLAAYKLLVEYHGGTYVYVQAPGSILRHDRNDQIIHDFDGRNYKELALRYGLSESTIRVIVEDDARRMRREPLDGQLDFFKKML